MPNTFIQHAFKMQIESIRKNNGQDIAAEEMMDELEDAMT